MYKVAVPEIPSIRYDNGELKPLIEPLWTEAPTLDASIWLSTSKTITDRDILIFRTEKLPSGWDLGFELDIMLEFVTQTNNSAKNSLDVLRARCDATVLPIPEFCLRAARAWSERENATERSNSAEFIIGEWSSAASKQALKALRQGKQLYAHAAVAWSGLPMLPSLPGFQPTRAVSATTSMVQVHLNSGGVVSVVLG